MKKLAYTHAQKALEALCIFILVATFVFLLVCWENIAQEIPMHYNIRGEIDRWGHKGELFILPVLSVLLYTGITLITHFPSVWNIPNIRYEQRKARVYQAVRTFLIILKLEIIGIFFYLNMHSATIRPLPVVFLPVMPMLTFGTIIFATICIYRIGYRRPKDTE